MKLFEKQATLEDRIHHLWSSNGFKVTHERFYYVGSNPTWKIMATVPGDCVPPELFYKDVSSMFMQHANVKNVQVFSRPIKDGLMAQIFGIYKTYEWTITAEDLK